MPSKKSRNEPEPPQRRPSDEIMGLPSVLPAGSIAVLLDEGRSLAIAVHEYPTLISSCQ